MSNSNNLFRFRAEFNWTPFVNSVDEAFRKLVITINAAFPDGVAEKQRRRAAASSVRMAYRNKKGKRW